MDMKDWNDGYWTEGLDRIHTIEQMIYALLTCDDHFHPSIVRAEMKDDVHNLLDVVHAMYNKMGEAIPDEEF